MSTALSPRFALAARRVAVVGLLTLAAPLAPFLAGPASGLPGLARAESAEVLVDGAKLRAGLRAEYLVGEQVVVPITVINPGATPLDFADLTSRPWLIRFELVSADGRKLRRSTAAPEVDEGRIVRIPVRGQRRTLLEIPGAGATAAGSYELAVQLVRGEQVTDILRQPVRFAKPRPVAGDMGPDAISGTRVGLQAAWVHQAAQGHDLYLHQARSEDPTVAVGSRHLLHLEAAVQPWLAAARTAEAAAPVVAWSQGPRTLRVLRVDGTGVVDFDRTVDAPWPAMEIAGRPGIAAGSVVGVPVWVPDPGGAGGELRVAVLGPGDRVAFAAVSRFDQRPASVRTTVDAAGAVQFLVSHPGGLDLYGLRSAPAAGAEALPLAGRRLLAATPGATLLAAHFGVLPEEGGHAGGLAIFTLVHDAAGLTGRWLDLRGNRVAELPVLPALPAGQSLVAALPGAAGRLGLLLRAGATLTWVEGGTRLVLGDAEGPVAVVRDAKGRAILRALSPAGAVSARVLPAAAP